MKTTGVIFVAVLVFSVQTNAGGGNENIPKKIVAGRNTLNQTPRERFKEVAKQIQQLNQESIDMILRRALDAHMQEMSHILPPWCMQIPASILVYVDFNKDDSDIQRALKFIRLAFFVRDMYLDFPINTDVFLTFATPQNFRLDDRMRYRLVAGSLLQAYQTMSPSPDAHDSDKVLSLANIATWALNYLRASGDADTLDGFQVALETYRYAEWASKEADLTATQADYVARLKALSMQSISTTLAPLLVFMLQNLDLQKGGK